MAQQLVIPIRGLWLHGCELQAPDGALSVADNVVIDRENVASPRRGFDILTTGFSDTSYRANKLAFYQSKLVAHYSTNLLAYYNAGVWTQLTGTFAPPANADTASAYSTIKTRFVQANQNLYFTTSAGVYKSDVYSATPVAAGAVKALDMKASTSASSSVWLATATNVAYRCLWGFKDANSNLILGAPSQREVYANSSGATKAVDLVVTVPAGISTSWFLQVYRSKASGAVDPSDEMGLVYEINPTSSNITDKSLSFTDIVPDELRGATLYTSATQEGIAAGNEAPPLAKDIAVYKDSMFFVNVVARHRYYLSLLAVGGTSGIAADDTITVGGITYTGRSSETAASAQFAVVTGGSASQNIRDTAVSLCRVINRYSSSTVYAYYLSGPDNLPGKILFESRTLGTSSFAVTSIRASVSGSTLAVCWSPDLPLSGTAESSVNDSYKNGVTFSKTNQPEAVPLTNFFTAGSKDDEILRALPLTNSLFLLKSDGVYRVTGDDASNFRVDLFDSTARILAPESAVVLNNQIWALTDQGVVSITEGGVQVRSRPIESTLLSLQGQSLDKLRNLTFGVGYETERKYILFVPALSSDTSATQQYVFNTFTNTWTKWTLSKTCGIVGPSDDKLYLGDSSSEYVNQERKSFSYADHVDYGFVTTINAVAGTTLTLTSVDNVTAGDVIRQSATVFSTVESVDSVAGTCVVSYNALFTAASATILKAISTKVAWVPITFGNPGLAKQIREVGLLFKSDYTGTASILFSSDASPAQETETVVGTSIGLWGLFAWGSVPWGGQNVRRPIRLLVPRNKQRCTQLTVEFRHAVGYAAYQLNGISAIGEVNSERFRRA